MERKENAGTRHTKSHTVPCLQIQYDNVLLNDTGCGTICWAKPYLVTKHLPIPDYHLTILRTPTLDPANLPFYLSSQTGRLHVGKPQRGLSGQLELCPFDIRKFQVWEAPQSLQKEIWYLSDQATESTNQSYELLEKAKSRVEELVKEEVQP